MPYVIGVDVGSQSVKAVLLDPAGTCVQTAASPVRMSHPAAGWAEQDPFGWEQAVADAVGLLMDGGPDPGEVAVLAFACQVDGVVAADGHELDPSLPRPRGHLAPARARHVARSVRPDDLVAEAGDYVCHVHTSNRLLLGVVMHQSEPRASARRTRRIGA